MIATILASILEFFKDLPLIKQLLDKLIPTPAQTDQQIDAQAQSDEHVAEQSGRPQ